MRVGAKGASGASGAKGWRRRSDLVEHGGRAPLDADVAHRRGDDPLAVSENFHSQPDADPADFQQTAAESRSVDSTRRRVRKELTALHDHGRVTRYENTVARIACVNGQRGQRLDIAKVNAGRACCIIDKAVERRDTRDESIVRAEIQNGRGFVHVRLNSTAECATVKVDRRPREWMSQSVQPRTL